MRYSNIRSGTFIDRPNRFIAQVEIDGKTEICHVKNTGRCKELLIPGATLILERAKDPNRKTPYSVVGVYKGERLVNIDSQAPNRAAKEWLEQGGLDGEKPTLLRPEYSWGGSRFDFYIEQGTRRALLEVKGVTLEVDGGAYFPDAPTQRGVRHIHHLMASLSEGFEACILFVIQMEGVSHFSPNDITHPAFGDALREAQKRGVRLFAYDCSVSPDAMAIRAPVSIWL